MILPFTNHFMNLVTRKVVDIVLEPFLVFLSFLVKSPQRFTLLGPADPGDATTLAPLVCSIHSSLHQHLFENKHSRSFKKSIYYVGKIESLNLGRRVLGNGSAEYEIIHTTVLC